MAADKRKASRHTETERKFAVTEDTVSPSFQGLSAVGRIDRSDPQHSRRRLLRHRRSITSPRTG